MHKEKQGNTFIVPKYNDKVTIFVYTIDGTETKTRFLY